MERPSGDMRVLRFGPFEANFTRGELCKHGIRLKLQDQPFHVLKMLLARPGELVTREEIRQALWPSGTFVDFDNGLNAAINRLREALGDSAEHPRFIETLPRRGYRFIAAINGSPQTGVLVGVQPAATAARWRTAKSVGLGLLILAFVVSILVAFNVGDVRRRLLSRGAASHVESLAVLPLENLSDDPAEEYFADGVTEELITDLAQISALRVISRTSAMQYKSTKKSLPQIARELNVDAVVEGAVQHSGDRVRITAQLIRAPTDTHLWAKSYERKFSDLLQLQSEVAKAIASEIEVKLTPQEQKQLASVRPVDAAAHEAYLRGRYFWYKETPDSRRQAIEYFQSAIQKDPTYAPAYAGLADCYEGDEPTVLLKIPWQEAHAKARAASQKALELDESLAEAHVSLATVLGDDWDIAGAKQELERALELNPGSAWAHENYAGVLVIQGQLQHAIAEANRALDLDPVSVHEDQFLGWAFYVAREYDRAIGQLRRTVEMDPSFAYAHFWLGITYSEKLMHREAISELQQAVTLTAGDPQMVIMLAWAHARSGDKPEAERMLGSALKQLKQGYFNEVWLGAVYASLGQQDNAFHWLEIAYRQHNSALFYVPVDPVYDALRSDPRFQELVRRMNF